MAINVIKVGICVILLIAFIISTVILFFRLKRKKNKTEMCKECSKKIKGSDKVCPHCGVTIKRTGALILNVILCIIITVSLLSFIGILIYSNNVNKYEEALNYFENKEYDKASELFDKLNGYENSDGYLKLIDSVKYLEDEKYQEALDLINAINTDDINTYGLKRFATNGINFQNKDYAAIFEDNKYNNTYYNDKEKEIVQESLYIYGTTKYKEGYINTAKQALDKIKDYKDVSTILSDKYFGLIGNHYLYSVASGYTIGMVSLLFYPYGDKISYTVYTQSIFNTNIPSGYDYEYRIINNQIVMGNYSIVYDIVSYDGNILKIRQGGSTFTLEKQ